MRQYRSSHSVQNYILYTTHWRWDIAHPLDLSVILVSDNLHLPPTRAPTFPHRGFPPTCPKPGITLRGWEGSTTTAAGGEIKASLTCNPKPASHTRCIMVAATCPTAEYRTGINVRLESQYYKSHIQWVRLSIWLFRYHRCWGFFSFYPEVWLCACGTLLLRPSFIHLEQTRKQKSCLEHLSQPYCTHCKSWCLELQNVSFH